MKDSHDQSPDAWRPQFQPRRFIYRSATPDTNFPHPLRRSTDMPHPFQAFPDQLCPKPLLLKFRVYLKVN